MIFEAGFPEKVPYSDVIILITSELNWRPQFLKADIM